MRTPARTHHPRFALFAALLFVLPTVALLAAPTAAAETVTELASLPEGRMYAAVTNIGVSLYVVGGCTSFSNPCSATVLEFDPPNGVYNTVATLPEGRGYASAATWDEAIYVFGGVPSTSGAPTSTIYRVTLAGSVTQVGTLPEPRSGTAAVWGGNAFYVFGGGSTKIVKFDPLTGVSSYASVEFPSSISSPAAAMKDGVAFVAVGMKIFAFDPIASTLAEVGQLPYETYGAGAAAACGAVYVLGGHSAQLTPFAAVHRFWPSNGTVDAEVAHFPQARAGPGVAPWGSAVHAFGGERHGAILANVSRVDATYPTDASIAALRADQVGGSTVRLDWTPTCGQATYEVWRGPTPGTMVLITSGATTTRYYDSGVGGGPTYYKVRAFVDGVPGPFSHTVLIGVDNLSGPPRDLLATPWDASVHLTWRPPADTAGQPLLRYDVYRVTGATTKIAEVAPTSTSFWDAPLSNGTQQTYEVRAVTQAGESDPSNRASATPDAGWNATAVWTLRSGVPGTNGWFRSTVALDYEARGRTRPSAQPVLAVTPLRDGVAREASAYLHEFESTTGCSSSSPTGSVAAPPVLSLHTGTQRQALGALQAVQDVRNKLGSGPEAVPATVRCTLTGPGLAGDLVGIWVWFESTDPGVSSGTLDIRLNESGTLVRQLIGASIPKAQWTLVRFTITTPFTQLTDLDLALHPARITGTTRTQETQTWRFDGLKILTGAAFTETAEGTHQWQARVVDGSGFADTTRPYPIRIDTVPPTSTGALTTGISCAAGWNRASVTFSANGSDATSGLARVEYRFGSSWATMTAPVTVGTDGTHNFRWRAVDVAGHIEAERGPLCAKIDRTPPTTTLSVSGAGDNGWFRGDVQVTGVSSDATSGVASTTCRLNGAQTGSSSFTVTAEGLHTVECWAVDHAGNEGTKATRTLRIDRTPVLVTARAPAPGTVTLVADFREVRADHTDDVGGFPSGVDASRTTFKVERDLPGIPGQPIKRTDVTDSGTIVRREDATLWIPHPDAVLAPGTYTVTGGVYDIAGTRSVLGDYGATLWTFELVAA